MADPIPVIIKPRLEPIPVFGFAPESFFTEDFSLLEASFLSSFLAGLFLSSETLLIS